MRVAGEDEVGGIGDGYDGYEEKEERMLVSVRIRPLNSMEIAKNEFSVWECISNTTIKYQNKCFYEFGRVFGCECTTKQVYEDAAKEVVFSVVNGVNSSVFAYGQTSSGKTYTMNGITECSVADIYEYIERHEEREFILKFSAIEIYNEVVRDLLSTDASPLRVLDDPERGTIVEKLREETVRNEDHLKALLLFCQAQRQIGETSLNERSSRSHQILRLTIESSARQYSDDKDNFSTLSACVNFIDLAGSERASQALSEGTRLKEGSHINRSLLALGTVIRKLSNGRNGHIPYRDSKLTRILQSSLGGNARTAIICTISPAQSHFEQSRNTLLFATCAREVVASAHVNVIMSDKAMVKHLQKKLARLETEHRYTSLASGTFHSDALRERDARIRKMEKEMKELIQQRDLAQSRLEDLLLVVGDEQASREWDELSQLSASYVSNAYDEVISVSDTSFDPLKEEYCTSPRNFSVSPMSNSVLVTCQGTEEAEQDSYSDFEDLCKEVQCIEVEEQKTIANKRSNPLFSVGHQKHASQGSSLNMDKKLLPNEVSAFSLVKEENIQNVRINDTATVRMDTDESNRSLDPMTNWLIEFEKRRREIIELWHACNVSLIHRTYFLLLFKGDPADSVYMEVEHRRLLFLKDTIFSSTRNLRREREMLCRQMRRMLSAIERERLYSKWGIELCSKKRRMQLANLLWSETTENMEHVRESASLVAKLTGFLKPEHALREMFGLSFTPQLMYTRSCSCRNGLYANLYSIEFF